jgi:hypothetical protein
MQVTPGYAGGSAANPSYKQVIATLTGLSRFMYLSLRPRPPHAVCDVYV